MNRILSPILIILVLMFTIAFGSSCGPSVKGDELPVQSKLPAEPKSDANVSDQEDLEPGQLDKIKNEHWTGDIDGMAQRRYIRAIVVYSKTNFFYDGPRTRGVSFDALIEFERFLNKRMQTGSEPIHIIFIPVTQE